MGKSVGDLVLFRDFLISRFLEWLSVFFLDEKRPFYSNKWPALLLAKENLLKCHGSSWFIALICNLMGT